MPDNNTCDHDACSCQAPANADYCSDHCKDAADQDIVEIRCDCGHDNCG